MLKKRLFSIIICLAMFASIFSAASVSAATEEKAERTILLYMCGADLESMGALATANLRQVLKAGFSKDNKVKVVVMTGGSEDWWLSENECFVPENTPRPEGYTFESTTYNRIWEAKGKDAAENPGRLVLLDTDGIFGDAASPNPAQNESMSDPETLKAFINYGVENYPAEKYDLVLWDHGGGPVSGFAYDEHSPDKKMMSLPDILKAISENKVTQNGGTFDFIDFDACLMNSVELNLTLSGYTDYYIASAETEPGAGQDYTGWLNMLGRDPNTNTFELGKQIVDDYIKQYKDEDGNDTNYATLAVVNTKSLMNAGFAKTIQDLTAELKSQLNTPDENQEYLYYDELDSAKRSIQYGKPDTHYKDLGNLVGQLAVTNKEISMKNLNETGGFRKVNDYADAAAKIIEILNNENIIYSRHTDNLTLDTQIQIDENQDLIYEDLAPTGMYIYYPAIDDSDYIFEYLDAISGSLEHMNNAAAETALAGYANYIAQQALAVEIAFTVDYLIDMIGAENVNYDTVKENLDQGGERTFWNQRILKLFEFFTEDGEDKTEWLRTIISQQVADHIQPENITIRSDRNHQYFKVSIENTKKRSIDSVKAKVFVELPAALEFIQNEPFLSYYLESQPEMVGCSIRTLTGTPDTSDQGVDYMADPLETILEKYIQWYGKDFSVWNLNNPDDSVYALQDAEGALHAVQVEVLDNNRLAVYFRWTDPTAEYEWASEFNGYLVFEQKGSEYVLSEICPRMQYGDRLISVNDLAQPVENVTTSYPLRIRAYPFTLVPMSKTTFGISRENAGSIKLVQKRMNEVDDIENTNGDEFPFQTRIVVTNIYQHDIDITERLQSDELINVKELSVEPVFYNGKEQGPKVTYNGEVLEEGKDYIWSPLDDTVLYKEVGTYPILLAGFGSRFVGRTETAYSILPQPASFLICGVKNKTYTGKKRTQNLTVQVRQSGKKVTLKEGIDYTVSYSKNRRVGTAYAVVKGKGNYSGKKTVTFRIRPKRTGIKYVKRGKNSLRVKWKRQTVQTTGYVIQASTSKSFKKIAAKKVIRKNKTTSAKLEGLKSGKKYYVRIRTYKKVNGKNYYSTWKVYKKAVKTRPSY